MRPPPLISAPRLCAQCVVKPSLFALRAGNGDAPAHGSCLRIRARPARGRAGSSVSRRPLSCRLAAVAAAAVAATAGRKLETGWFRSAPAGAGLRRRLLCAPGPCYGDVAGRGAMRGLALPRSSLGMVILTFACVLMDESEGIPPVPYMLQLRRVTLDRRGPFNILRREKRQVQCQLGQYLHPKRTHCCMRCHAGTYKAKDCKWPDQAPVCLPCPNGTFTAVDNIMKKCFQCTRCRTELQQIEETPCTLKQDTVCGCRKNQYQFGQTDFFQCKNCSPCVNGVIANCSKDRDAICRCKPMFFLTLNNVCKHCNSCVGEECLQCNSPVTTSPNSSELNGNLVLGIIVAVIVVICVLYIVNKTVKLVQKNGIAASFYSCVSLPQTSKEPVSEVEAKGSAIAVLPEIQKEKELLVNATPPSVPLLQSSHELPDCVRPARKRQLPDNPAILYTVVDHVPPSRWKEFVRRLGLTDYDLERIEMEHRRLRDAQYEMVRLWKLQMGHAATVEHISCVLNQMELSGCSEAIQEALLNQNSHQPCSFHSHL